MVESVLSIIEYNFDMFLWSEFELFMRASDGNCEESENDKLAAQEQ